MKALWTEAERHTMFRYYWLRVRHVNAPRHVRVMMAEQLALANLQALAKQVEEGKP